MNMLFQSTVYKMKKGPLRTVSTEQQLWVLMQATSFDESNSWDLTDKAMARTLGSDGQGFFPCYLPHKHPFSYIKAYFGCMCPLKNLPAWLWLWPAVRLLVAVVQSAYDSLQTAEAQVRAEASKRLVTSPWIHLHLQGGLLKLLRCCCHCKSELRNLEPSVLLFFAEYTLSSLFKQYFVWNGWENLWTATIIRLQ